LSCAVSVHMAANARAMVKCVLKPDVPHGLERERDDGCFLQRLGSMLNLVHHLASVSEIQAHAHPPKVELHRSLPGPH
jgi:hypothetical protein